MHKKRLNIILIVSVTLIWGVLLFKFVSPYFKQTDTVITADVLVKKTIVVTQNKDTVNLYFPQRDPFLGISAKVIRKKNPTKVVRKITTKVAVKPITWPKIEYLGFVKSKTNAKRLGLIRIDGTLYRVNKNEIMKGLRIVLIDKVSILVMNGKEKKYFKKK